MTTSASMANGGESVSTTSHSDSLADSMATMNDAVVAELTLVSRAGVRTPSWKRLVEVRK